MKIIATDFDGTLSFNGKVRDEDKAAIARFRQAGNKFGVVTGRDLEMSFWVKSNCPELDFITRHSMLRQKLCDAATDALRLLKLESHGYVTATIELIDPNETPKNVMLRAIRKKNFNENSKEAIQAKESYLNAKKFLCGEDGISKYHF